MPKAGTATKQDAIRILNGVLDDWENHPDMNHPVGDEFRHRIYNLILALPEADTNQ